MLPNLAWTLTPVTLVLGEHKPGENDGDFGRNEVLKERGEDRVSLAAMLMFGCCKCNVISYVLLAWIFLWILPLSNQLMTWRPCSHFFIVIYLFLCIVNYTIKNIYFICLKFIIINSLDIYNIFNLHK